MVEGLNDGAIRAAGGVLWRPAAGANADSVEIAVIHRPRYDDWSIPKGKLHPGEVEIEGAIREVTEETGYRAAIERPLGEVAYLKDGRPKIVRYWAMRAEGGIFSPSREVDELRWLPAEDAIALLSREHDRNLVADFIAGPVTTSTILLVRHASAGNRSAWGGDDEERPLDAAGRDQAEALIWLLTNWHIRELISAPYVRCLQTVEPLGLAVGLAVRPEHILSEDGYPGNEQEALQLLRAAGAAGTATVVCSQGNVIPDLLSIVAAEDGYQLPDALPCKKGSFWSLTLADGQLQAAEYFPPVP